jgi:pyruvate/2-oxoglutarate dehydrogenase complex dihydrolipoamide acyltransferase (E2) component
MKGDSEMVMVEVRPGKPFHTILKKDKARRRSVNLPPGSRFRVNRRQARAFADRLKVVSDPRRQQPPPPPETVVEGTPPDAEGEAEEEPTTAPPVEQPAATESAVKLAAEIEVDLVNVKGTGAGGRILLKDVKAAAA